MSLANTDFVMEGNYYSDGYYTYQEAYTNMIGNIDSPCRGNNDCHDGLSCQTNPSSGWQSCRLPPKVEDKCNRSHTDQRCHHITEHGTKVLCPDKYCSPKPAEIPTPVDPIECSRSKLHYHQPSGASFCGSLNQTTGQFKQMPEKCCHTSMAHMWDLEPDYVTYSLSPQYYGVNF